MKTFRQRNEPSPTTLVSPPRLYRKMSKLTFKKTRRSHPESELYIARKTSQEKYRQRRTWSTRPPEAPRREGRRLHSTRPIGASLTQQKPMKKGASKDERSRTNTVHRNDARSSRKRTTIHQHEGKEGERPTYQALHNFDTNNGYEPPRIPIIGAKETSTRTNATDKILKVQIPRHPATVGGPPPTKENKTKKRFCRARHIKRRKMLPI